ncbi:acetyltransferase [Desulfovermiculus halophilus]|uniref:acetyltransferase n=1 Tax=Desulfovermiculus halophilus TaxID=339722 RepID=UPI000A072198|nr:acetyltransferase [Desulfovermiculus halophilus]
MDIVLAGGGALGRVIFDFLYYQKYNIKAFMDDDPSEKDLYYNVPTTKFDQIDKYNFPDTKFIISVLTPNHRESIVEFVTSHGGIFYTYIDNNSFVSPSASLGNGCVLLPYSFVMSKACVGNYVHVHFNSTIGHDVIVGDYCSFAPQCVVGGYVTIGKNVTFGMGANILPKIKIGDFATIGAGCVVTNDIPEGATVVGNPGKIIK